jgi:hypothetical protein
MAISPPCGELRLIPANAGCVITLEKGTVSQSVWMITPLPEYQSQKTKRKETKEAKETMTINNNQRQDGRDIERGRMDKGAVVMEGCHSYKIGIGDTELKKAV